MNSRIMKTDVSNLLFIDIECARASKELDINSREYETYEYKNRDRKTGDLLPSEELIDLYNKTAALSPIYGKVICVSAGFVVGNKFMYKCITGTEAEIITEFFELVNSSNKVLCGYNLISYDINYLLLRAAANNITVPLNEKMNTLGKKEWHVSDNILDLMVLLKGTGFANYSLDEITYLLDIDSPKTGVMGHQVSEVYWSGGIDRIAKYCNEDILATARIFLSLQGQKNLITELIDKTGAKVEKTPLMNAIANTKSITKEQEKEIVAKAKSLSKEEKLLFVELLNAALLENAVNYEKLLTKLAK